MFSKYGEVIGVRTFFDQKYAFVSFKTASEAMNAKDALNGRLFDDPAIIIKTARVCSLLMN